MLAATRLNSVCFVREMGELEAERVTSFCRGHPSQEHLPSHHSLNFYHASAKTPVSWVSRKSNQQRDGFAVPSRCLGDDGLGIVEKRETFLLLVNKIL